MKTVTTHEAKTHLSQLIAEAEAGEEIIICRGSRPVVRLTALSPDDRSVRLKVGVRTSAPIEYDDDALGPLSDRDLRDWGL